MSVNVSNEELSRTTIERASQQGRKWKSTGTSAGLEVVLILVAFVLLLTGCRSSVFKAGALPAKYRTVARSNRDTIDFSRVATQGTSEATIAPSDLLEITIATGREEEKIQPVAARVAVDGTVQVPVVGAVPVAGLEALEASQNIANFAIQRGMYRNPLVTVEIKSKAVNRITVLGAVNEPGVHEIPRGSCDLVSALAASGGLTDEAGTEIEIVRQANVGLATNNNTENAVQQATFQGPNPPKALPTTMRVDLSGDHPMTDVDVRLSDRDVVRVIPRKQETIYVAGLVKQPGSFEMPLDQDIHLLDAIALAGGRSSPVADKIYVIRRVENQPQPIVIQASLSKAKQNGLENLRLASGDTITIEQTPTTALVDSIRHFFRLSYGVASNSVF